VNDELGRTALTDHERYKELGALALSGALSPGEWAELRGHLQICESCREICRQYDLLVRDSIPLLAAACVRPEELDNWDDTATRRRLFEQIQGTQRLPRLKKLETFASRWRGGASRVPILAWAKVAFAGGALIAAMGVAYHLGGRASRTSAGITPHDVRLQELTQKKPLVQDDIEARRKKISELSDQGSQLRGQIFTLRSQVQALEVQSTELASGRNQAEEHLRTIAEERDSLVARLHDSEQAYQKLQAELVNLRSEREGALLRTASLQSKVDELTTLNRDQERRLKDAEEYLASDRDIRELMGARRLYIADVFDVDSGSRTQKPFGRVFYTESKSLIFYAFDLDQPGIKNASTFQVWGRKETPQGERARAMNLGILYMDNSSSRRWVMRSDDPKQLAEIDAIFVTVEPHGGSEKPTSKPFLYALLRNPINHP
jgi:predicted  nucleic acid-binding Zn-ribbon protein